MTTDRSPQRRSSTLLLAVVMVFALVFGACSQSSNTSSNEQSDAVETERVVLESEGTPQSGGTVAMAVTAETNGWNPALAQWADAGNFVGSTFLEPLLVYNSEGTLVPWLAESVTSDDPQHRSWTVKIRPGIMFHDGTELKANAFKRSIELAIFEGLSSVALGQLLDEIEVIDDYTFRAKLNVSWAHFPNVIAGQIGLAMSESMLDSADQGMSGPIGTGPYKFESWTPDKSVKVNRFDEYWGGPCALPDPGEAVTQLCEEAGIPLGQKNGPFLDAMEFRPIPDSLQRANALQSGELDLILTTRASDIAALQSDYQVVSDHDSERTFVLLNTAVPPFDNIHARKALAYATDRQEIVDAFGAGQQLGLDTSPFREDSRWGGLAPNETGYPTFNTEAARQEVEAYKADTGQPTLSFTFSGFPIVEDLDLQQNLLEQWREIGIEARIDTLEQTQFILKLTQAAFQAALFRNYGYPDPDSDYVFWSRQTAEQAIKINFSQYWSETTEAAVSWGRTAEAFEARQPGYEALVKDRNENAIDIWLFNTPYSLIGDKNIRGLNWFRSIGFGNFLPKPYMGGLWIDQSAVSSDA
jgi:peptide/nickel transport system substrate-binding protein